MTPLSCRRTALIGLLAAAFFAPVATAAPVPRTATFEDGGQAPDQVNEGGGTFAPQARLSFDGDRAAQARVRSGGNYARALFEVDWRAGDDVRYGAQYFLPRGFTDSMQGQVDVLRWDNWTIDPDTTDRSGVVIYGKDKRARLVRQRLGIEQVELGSSFALPEGRWFRLEVRQRLSTRRGALSEVFIDGRRVASSRAKNSYGRSVRRIRYGIVAVDERRQRDALELWVDDLTAGPATSSR